jgi:hypothetical protein
LSSGVLGGRSLWGLFPEAMFLRALRTEAILVWCAGVGLGTTLLLIDSLHVTSAPCLHLLSRHTDRCTIRQNCADGKPHTIYEDPGSTSPIMKGEKESHTQTVSSNNSATVFPANIKPISSCQATLPISAKRKYLL